VLLTAVCLAVVTRVAAAQVTPAAGTPPDDAPTIKIGSTIFTDYTHTQKPQAKDADGNTISEQLQRLPRLHQRDGQRLAHRRIPRHARYLPRDQSAAPPTQPCLPHQMRLCADQPRRLDAEGLGPPGHSTDAIHRLPETLRYRFQGTVFVEREGYLTSSDAGVSFHTTFPRNYGDIHVGLYNGDGYARAEANDQKAVQIRGTLRPLPMNSALRGLRLTGFYDADHYVANAERTRAIFNAVFEYRFVNAGFDYLATNDQQSAAPVAKADVRGRGWSIFVIPKFGRGFEGLVRYDHMRPDVENSLAGGNGVNKRTIAGLAYWFPHQGSVSSALLFDVENVTFSEFTTGKPAQQRLALHALIAF
jgi:hypothetical protein